MSNLRPHVLIAGGGIGGLSAALALLQRGFDVDVFEQAGKLEEVGAGVQLSPNGTRALQAMMDDLQTAGVALIQKGIQPEFVWPASAPA